MYKEREDHIARTYGDRTYVSDWDVKRLAYPKDNDPYCPAGGNQNVSTHNRLGTEPGTPFPISETQHMLQQILNPVEATTIKRAMVSFTSYPYTDTPDLNASIDSFGFPQYPKDHGYQEYLSTMQADYRAPRNTVRKPLLMENPPFMMNQKVHSVLRPRNKVWVPPHFGIVKYDDDDFVQEVPSPSLQLHYAFRKIRCNSYDPFLGKYQLEVEPPKTPSPPPKIRA